LIQINSVLSHRGKPLFGLDSAAERGFSADRFALEAIGEE
jgi:hypothetical protein